LAGNLGDRRRPDSRHVNSGGTIGRSPPRVYHPGHTAHLRQRLTQMAVNGLIGLVIAAIGAGVTATVASRANGASGSLVTAAWIAVVAVAAVACLHLLITLPFWRIYRRQRAELDAAGAEAVGEMHARIANLRRDGSN
jgi:hypothetical protein